VERTLTHKDVLEFATIDGARACALDDKVGSLTPGKQADIVLLKTDVINTAPVLDPLATIVTFADTANVDSVFVAGRAVKRNGQLVDVDVRSVVENLEASRDHILSSGGLLPDWCSEPAAAV
jgi:cytosine/adenosine deaminase-related metal-dependent hydrolase